MKKNIFLTGAMAVGKSTLIDRVLEDSQLRLGGYVTGREIQGDIQKFHLKSLADGKSYHLAITNRVTRAKDVREETLTRDMPRVLEKDLLDKELIVLDELGFMENDLEAFTSLIFRILDSPLPVFGVLKDYDCSFLNKIRSRDDVDIIWVDVDNRDQLYIELSEKIKKLL